MYTVNLESIGCLNNILNKCLCIIKINKPLVSQTMLKPSPRLKCNSELFQLK